VSDAQKQSRDDATDRPFTQIDNTVLHDDRLDRGHLMLYWVMRSFAWEVGGEICTASQKTLARMCRTTPRTIRRWLRCLEELHLVEKISENGGTGTTNHYRVPRDVTCIGYRLPREHDNSAPSGAGSQHDGSSVRGGHAGPAPSDVSIRGGGLDDPGW
jgi:hypothetical protein